MNEPTQACKNLSSGKYFLFVEEVDDENFLLVIPTGEVKSLETSLFGEIEDVNITDLLNYKLLTKQQIDGYKKFVEKDSIGLFREIMNSVSLADDMLEKFKIAQERLSKVQFEFVINRLVEDISTADR
jgi:hypothetical protein